MLWVPREIQKYTEKCRLFQSGEEIHVQILNLNLHLREKRRLVTF